MQERDQQVVCPKVTHVADRSGEVATDRTGALSGVSRQRRQRLLGGSLVGWLFRARQDDGGGGDNPRVRVVQKVTGQDGRIFVPNTRERANSRGPDIGARVADHGFNGGDPALGDIRTSILERGEGSGSDRGRFVVEEQRGDQVALVQRVQYLDGIQDAAFVGMRQLFHKGFDRRQVRDRQAHRGRFDTLSLEGLAE